MRPPPYFIVRININEIVFVKTSDVALDAP